MWNDANGDGLQGANEKRLPQITVHLKDPATGNTLDTRFTDENGEYEFPADPAVAHKIVVENPHGWSFTPQDVNGNSQDSIDSDVNAVGESAALSANTSDDVVDAGLFLTPGSATIGDRVWFDQNADGVQDAGETGIPGISVALKDPTGTTVATTSTATDGAYLFTNVAPGDYTVNFTVPSWATITAGAETMYASVVNGDALTDIDLGLVRLGSVSGLAWRDDDGNGVRGEEPLLSGIAVDLLNEDGVPIASTTTDADGKYAFTNSVWPGEYTVRFARPSGSIFTLKDAGGDTVDSDVDPSTELTDIISVAADQDITHVDAGVLPSPTVLSIGNWVWLDANENGLQDPTESGFEGVAVDLLSVSGAVLASTTTTQYGAYLFTDVAPGQYRVQFHLPTDEARVVAYAFTKRDEGEDITIDSDPDVATGLTAVFTVSPTQDRLDIDAGIIVVPIESGGGGGGGGGPVNPPNGD